MMKDCRGKSIVVTLWLLLLSVCASRIAQPSYRGRRSIRWCSMQEKTMTLPTLPSIKDVRKHDDDEVRSSSSTSKRDVGVDPIEINGDRWILPGDYVVHEEHGVGKFTGLRQVDLTPSRKTRTYQDVVVIQYADAEVTFFKRLIKQELWLYRQSLAGMQQLSSILENRKWKRLKARVESNSKSLAINLVKAMALRSYYHRPPYIQSESKFYEFEKGFKYTPTPDQYICFQDIENDMVNNTRPMDRLICGDVGFGKTEVAIRAIYRAVLSGRQVALLAPTRILALQHLRVLGERMPDINIALLRGGDKQSANIKESIKNGKCRVVVGTHALLQKNVVFKELGLLVIDEEQRFGVEQKEKWRSDCVGIDVLTLSATPIPRTLQMSLTGMKDLSVMTSPPVGRKDVKVKVNTINENLIKSAISAELDRQGKVFVVVPYVKNITSTYSMIQRILPEVKCVIVHGGIDDIVERMDFFSNGNAHVIIATTVIENGIDIPIANTMIVLDCDRFGMSTLYQLRGRVGRSDRQAFAYFLYDNNKALSEEANTRLDYLEAYTALGSGYDLSKRDMEIRGSGEVFGARQAGNRDIGLDLQNKVLQKAITELKKDIILPIPETRVSLDLHIENIGAKVNKGKQITDINAQDVNQLAIWETQLAKWTIFNIAGASVAETEKEILYNSFTMSKDRR